MQEKRLLKENGLWKKMMVLEYGTDQSERELQELTRLIPESVAGRSHYPGTE